MYNERIQWYYSGSNQVNTSNTSSERVYTKGNTKQKDICEGGQRVYRVQWCT